MSDTRVYIADLAAYVEGSMVGEWFTPTDYADADEFAEAVGGWLETLPHPAWTGEREEWAIHDYEGFGPLKLSEYESLTTVWSYAQGIEEHGQAFVAYVSSGYDAGDFEEAFAGEWGSGEEYAEEFVSDVYDLSSVPDFLRYHIDYEGVWRDFRLGGDCWSEDNPEGGVWIFRSI